MRVPVRFRPLIAGVVMCLLAASCADGGSRSDGRDAAETYALQRMDDSLSLLSPGVTRMLAEGMAEADDGLDSVDWYLRRQRYMISMGVPDSAELHYTEIFKYLSGLKQTPRIRGMLGYLLNTRGSYYMKLHFDPAVPIRAYSEAYAYLLGSDSENRLPDVCANLGDAYVAANDLPLAAWWYRRALTVSDSLRLPDTDNVSLYMGLGRIYLKLDDFDAAYKCYQKADRNFDIMSFGMKLYFLTNYGNYHYYKGEYDKAAALFMRMKRLLDANGMAESYEMYQWKLNMADVRLNLGDIEKAERLLAEAYPYFEKIGDETAVYYGNTVAIGIAIEKGDMARARKIIADEKIDATIDFSLREIRQRYLRGYYVENGDYRSAYNNLLAEIRRNDSLKHNVSNMRAYEIMMRYTQDTLRLHHELAIREKDAAISETRSQLWIIVLVAVALALSLFGVSMYSRKRNLQTHIQLMQLRLVNVRSRISPHFIFNVLNNRIAKTDKAGEEELMALVKLIRANLNMSGKYYVSLKEELDFVRYYISVERYIADGLEFTVDAPPDSVLEEVMIPSMFIQILVENSIKHGLKQLEGRKTLRVTVTVDSAECVVKVADNGPGFDIRRSNPASTKTGLKVIRNTINIINRNNKHKTRLDIHNTERPDGSIAGCEVTLVMPLMQRRMDE